MAKLTDKAQEALPEANSIAYDNTSSGLGADNLQDAVDEVNTLTPPNPNFCINGSLDFWQRGTNFVGVSNIYTADRIRQYGAAADVSKDTGDAPASAGQSFQFKPTTTSQVGYTYTMEASETDSLRGQYVTVSMYVKTGSAYTGNLTLQLGRGLSEAISVDATYGSLNLNNQINSSGWTKVSLTTNQVVEDTAVVFSWSLSRDGHTAGANEEVKIANIKIETGSRDTQWTRYGGSLAADYVACQRYYQKSYSTATDPGSVTQLNAVFFSGVFDITTIEMPVTMRTSPTVISYSTTNGEANRVYNRSTASNNTPTVTNIGDNRFSLSGVNVSGQHYVTQWTASAEI